MKRLFALVFVLSVSATAAAAQDIDKGRDAYNRGDHAEAFKLLMPIAESGNAEAQFHVAVIYSDGEGVPKDMVIAMKWLKSSADGGLGEAQFILGTSYKYGTGVPKDRVLAYMWLNLASGAQMWLPNNPDGKAGPSAKEAAKVRDILAKDMTPAEIKEAQRRTREWLDAHPR